MKTKEELIAFARETLGLPGESPAELSAFAGRGSDRAYFRFRWDAKNSVILVHYRTTRIENTFFVDIARFLLDNGIPVPQIIRHDEASSLILMQDLGDRDLWSLRSASWEMRKNLYRKTLSIAHRLHSFDEKLFPSARIRIMDAFGPDLYRWERRYFLDHFVHDLCRIRLEPELEQRLETELEEMARRLASGGRHLVHRDLQSRNVIICGEAPFLIDFQGLRFGTPFYDMGSLLCDPYVAFSESQRAELLWFYYGLSKMDMDWEAFQIRFWEASAQRLMQALGAFGLLGLGKGLKLYLAHVPAGCRNLRMAAENAGCLPSLVEICASCGEALARTIGRPSHPKQNRDGK